MIIINPYLFSSTSFHIFLWGGGQHQPPLKLVEFFFCAEGAKKVLSVFRKTALYIIDFSSDLLHFDSKFSTLGANFEN